MSEETHDLDEHEVEVVEAISKILDALPSQMSPADISNVIVNLIGTFDMDDMWPIIALDATYILKKIREEEMLRRTLN